jgi:hypothetical protein
MSDQKSKQERMLELADVLEREDRPVLLSKDMLHIVMTDRARDLIVEALRIAAQADAGAVA